MGFSDYAAWEAAQETSEEVKGAEAYWLGQFQGSLPVLDLPLDHPRPRIRQFDGGTVKGELSAELVASLRTLAAREGGTFFSSAFAAFAILMSRDCDVIRDQCQPIALGLGGLQSRSEREGAAVRRDCGQGGGESVPVLQL